MSVLVDLNREMSLIYLNIIHEGIETEQPHICFYLLSKNILDHI